MFGSSEAKSTRCIVPHKSLSLQWTWTLSPTSVCRPRHPDRQAEQTTEAEAEWNGALEGEPLDRLLHCHSCTISLCYWTGHVLSPEMNLCGWPGVSLSRMIGYGFVHSTQMNRVLYGFCWTQLSSARCQDVEQEVRIAVSKLANFRVWFVSGVADHSWRSVWSWHSSTKTFYVFKDTAAGDCLLTHLCVKFESLNNFVAFVHRAKREKSRNEYRKMQKI